jgi:D-alanyl-D-alanine dipeptidase
MSKILVSKVLYILLIVAFFSCENKSEKYCSKCNEDNLDLLDSLEQVEGTKKNKVLKDSLLQKSNLIDIQDVNESILVDLKYSTTDNFMHIKLYNRLKSAFLQKDVAIRLGKCQDYLNKLNPKFHLLIYDAVRPLSIQQKMWDALDTIPFEERTKFVSNPANGSIHNYGAAVDLTISDENGNPLDMGAGYDDIRQIAYPRLEEQFLASGELSVDQIENRKLLRKVMESQGFKNIATEWWHFNACPRNEAKQKYTILLTE